MAKPVSPSPFSNYARILLTFGLCLFPTMLLGQEEDDASTTEGQMSISFGDAEKLFMERMLSALEDDSTTEGQVSVPFVDPFPRISSQIDRMLSARDKAYIANLAPSDARSDYMKLYGMVNLAFDLDMKLTELINSPNYLSVLELATSKGRCTLDLDDDLDQHLYYFRFHELNVLKQFERIEDDAEKIRVARQLLSIGHHLSFSNRLWGRWYGYISVYVNYFYLLSTSFDQDILEELGYGREIPARNYQDLLDLLAAIREEQR